MVTSEVFERRQEHEMSVIASITTSVDGYVTGPDDGPGQGLSIGGERLHYWVMGGPWTYERRPRPRRDGGRRQRVLRRPRRRPRRRRVRARHVRAAGAWGGTNPFRGTLFVLTHRTGEAPDPSTGFVFVDGLATAMDRASAAAAGGDVSIGGGADVIRQALAAGYLDELAISTAPVVLGAGKRLFDGFRQDIDLEVAGSSSPYATHSRRVRRTRRAPWWPSESSASLDPSAGLSVLHRRHSSPALLPPGVSPATDPALTIHPRNSRAPTRRFPSTTPSGAMSRPPQRGRARARITTDATTA